MNDDPTPDPHTGLDQWLDHGMNALNEALNDMLDTDAGLRDAQLPARHQSVETTLDAILDVDAGLHAILPRVHPHPTETAGDDRPLRAYARRLANLPLRERLELRRQIHLDHLRTVQHIANARLTAGALIRVLVDFSPAGTPNGARDLDHARYQAQALARSLDAVTRDHARLPNRVRNHARFRDRALALALALAHAQDRAEGLVLALNRAEYLNHELALNHAEDLDHELNRAVALALNRALNRALDRDLDRALFLARAEVLVEDIAAVNAAVTDFTAADLTDVDLRGISLHGIQWSTETTHWPHKWRDAIREASVQIDPRGRPDVYEIRDEPRVPITFDAEHR
ncbi:hypothetical protein [Actinophytocola sediminis]